MAAIVVAVSGCSSSDNTPNYSSSGGTGGTATGGTGGIATDGTGGIATGGTGGIATGGTGGIATGGTGGTASGGTGGTASGGTGGTSGTSCQNPKDCPDPNTMVCDPATAKCTTSTCSSTATCGNTNDTCVLQQTGAKIGACYPSCTPFTINACSGNSECLALNGNYTSGACFGRGTTTEGQACSISAINTSCATGMVCINDANGTVCRKQCPFFASSPGCLNTQRCISFDVCTVYSGDSAAIGAKCSTSSASGDICGNDGKAWRGVCVNTAPADAGVDLTCLEICRTSGSACPGTQTCQAVFTDDPTMGVCG